MNFADLDMYCRECGYPLHGLQSRSCPECGMPFNPLEPSTYSTTPETDDEKQRQQSILPPRFVMWTKLAGTITALLLLPGGLVVWEAAAAGRQLANASACLMFPLFLVWQFLVTVLVLRRWPPRQGSLTPPLVTGPLLGMTLGLICGLLIPPGPVLMIPGMLLGVVVGLLHEYLDAASHGL
ncbi:MAG: hypothetical protein ACOCTI_04715 [Phycisphaeraceae bacterium]